VNTLRDITLDHRVAITQKTCSLDACLSATSLDHKLTTADLYAEERSEWLRTRRALEDHIAELVLRLEQYEPQCAVNKEEDGCDCSGCDCEGEETPTPTLSSGPSTSPAPTISGEFDVSTDTELSDAVDSAPGDGRQWLITLISNLMVRSEIKLVGSTNIKIAGDSKLERRALVRPTLVHDGGFLAILVRSKPLFTTLSSRYNRRCSLPVVLHAYARKLGDQRVRLLLSIHWPKLHGRDQQLLVR
jgi:hypothetical protein